MKVLGNNRGMVLGKLCLLALCLLMARPSLAAVTASVDRDRVAMGDTMRLVISATANEPINNADLRPILKDFEVLQRSNSSSTNIVNGQTTQTREIILDIRPRRVGTLRVPALQVGTTTTNYLLISVGPAPVSASGGQTIIFEAELDRAQTYVQGQVILTLRVQQAVNLDSRSITELQLDNAFVTQLEQNSFQRTIQGRPWLIHEIRYAIFPEQSGLLSIPSQTFTARESTGRRGIFDMNSGRQINRESRALTIDVLPRPQEFSGSTWLPARNLTIEEQWSTPPEQLKIGESVTRTISIKGEGLQGAQLPPIQFKPSAGLKYYPDQPVIDNSEVGSGLLGSRVDSAALVPTAEGSYKVPEVRIPWWDIEAGKIRYAVLPATEIAVAAGDPGSRPPAAPISSGDVVVVGNTAAPSTAMTDDAGPWKIATALTALGWFISLLFIVLKRRKKPAPKAPTTNQLNEANAFKQLMAACAGNNGAAARKAFVDWGSLLYPESAAMTLEATLNIFDDKTLTSAFEQLNRQLYGTNKQQWDGTEMADLLRSARKGRKTTLKNKEPALQLYPN